MHQLIYLNTKLSFLILFESSINIALNRCLSITIKFKINKASVKKCKNENKKEHYNNLYSKKTKQGNFIVNEIILN